ncbi:hypothetical protein F4677DRAFT_231411 [Hypoxylon crocopeplum]|nr:hypothetical protein F4677DRAFT_231411 [Hypoxylon crocopeplum]
MCRKLLTLVTDNTSSEHDTRFVSVINPATSYTVYSPWQDPYSRPPCVYPHIFHAIPPNQCCFWHQGCCRLDRRLVCSREPMICNGRVKYHHFIDEDNGDTQDLSFLSAYIRYDPILLRIPGWFFKAGVELGLASMYRSQVLRRLNQAANYNSPDATERRTLEAKLASFSNVISAANTVLGQFARLWDLYTENGMLPPRPGKEPIPEQNALYSTRLNLRVGAWTQPDTSTFPWPQLVQLWPHLQAGDLPFHDDPAVIPLANPNNKALDAGVTLPFSDLSLGIAPVQQLVFNPDMPLISPGPPSPPLPVLAPTPTLGPASLPWVGRVTPSPPRQPLPSSSSSSYLSPPVMTLDTIHARGLDLDFNMDSDGSDQAYSEESERAQEGLKEYAIEALIDHRPHGVPHSSVRSYRVRWDGDWPPRQKETWQKGQEIAPHIVDNYWRELAATR